LKSIFIADDNILSFFPKLTPAQKNALNNLIYNYTTKNTLSGDALDVSAFITGLVPNPLEIWSNNQPVKLNGDILGFPLTRVRSSLDVMQEIPNPVTAKASTSVDQGVYFRKINVKFGTDEKNRSNYPKLSDITLRARDIFVGSSLALVLKSIKVFAADRVNFQFDPDKAQLPASAIGYSLYVNGNFFPQLQYTPTLATAGGSLGASGSTDGTGTFTWPDSMITTNNCHVKIYNPDYIYNSPGFAHSINLHLVIISFSIFGPLGDFLGAGALPYNGIIIGPSPFLQQLTFFGTSQSSDQTKKTVSFDQVINKQQNGLYSLFINDSAATVAQNVTILPYLEVLNTKQDFYNLINNQNVIEQDLDNQSSTINSYRLRFINEFGQTFDSEKINGGSQRLTTYFNAYDELPAGNFSQTNLAYNSFVSISDSNNRLYDLFTKSKPLIIFKLNTQTYTSNLVFKSGFISASIQSYVKDNVGIFDTKIIYRIYSVPNSNSQNFDPNNEINKQNTLKITNNSSTSKSYVSFEKFDNTWTFDNVLSTGNLQNSPTYVNTEVLVNGYWPNENPNIHFNVLGDEAKNSTFYCAIYAISTLNDDPAKYNLNSYTSLDFPVVNFILSSDFVLLLPFFYLISYDNGGYIRPQRDLGYVGDYSVKDTQVYTVYDTLYGGNSFDNSKPYAGVFSTTDGFDKLLVCDFDSSQYPNAKTNFSVTLKGYNQNSISITEVDFVVISSYNLENAKISDDSNYNIWTVTFQTNNELSGIYVKFEIDLIGSNFQNLLKIVSSGFVAISGSQVVMNQVIGQSFYLPSSGGSLILRLIFSNSSIDTTIEIANLQITKNSIKYFSYGTPPPGAASQGFYEDLPLQPAGFVGECTQFSLYLDLPTSGSIIFDADSSHAGAGLPINGAIYSSTWVLPNAYPKGMEVVTKGILNDSFATGTQSSGTLPYKIFFRTGAASSISSIDTKRHGNSNLILAITNSLTNSLQNGIWQVISESYPRFFTYGNYLTTYDKSGNIQKLILSNPTLNTTTETIIQGHNQTFSDNNTLSLTIQSPGSYAAQTENPGIINSINSQQEQKIRMTYCSFVSFAYSENKVFTLGATPGGNLLYSETSVWDQTQNYNIVLVEGDTKSRELPEISPIILNDAYYGLVNVGFPAIAATSSSETIIFYIYTSGKNVRTNNAIYAKVIDSNVPANPVLLFDFQSYLSDAIIRSGLSNFIVPQIQQLAIYKDEYYPGLYYLVFDCDSKIFLIKVIYSLKAFNFVDVVMLLGIHDPSVKKTDFISVLNQAIINAQSRTGNIISIKAVNGSSSPYLKELSNSQKAGIVDFDGSFMGVQFLDGQNLYEVVFDKSYTLGIELRIIGVKPG
jgi:hypothetical protein